MPKSTRRGRGSRVDVIELFSPRRSGPWHLLRPLRTRWAFALAALLGVILLASRHAEGALGLVTAYLLGLLLSFSVVWQLWGLLIRSRAELATLAGSIGVNLWLRSFLPGVWAGVGLLGALIVAFTIPWSARWVTARFWCVLDRHRLRLCLRQTKVRTMNMDGSLPLMLWARPTTIGERVWMWVRAGTSGGDIEDAVEYIAPACYAREARVTATRKLTTLVVVDIIRRDPLGARHRIPSPLAGLLGRFTRTTSGEGTDPIRPTDLADVIATRVEDTPPSPSPAKGRTKAAASSSSPSTPTTPAPVLVNGEDLSDYID